MNIAIFSPSQNPYSETFIQAHKNFLAGNIFYYYGHKGNIILEKHPELSSFSSNLYLKLKRKLLGLSGGSLWIEPIIQSLKKNDIDVVLVEYGTHAQQLLGVYDKVKIPIVVHFHGYDASIEKVVVSHNHYKEIFIRASYIMVVSKKMREMIIDMGCPKDKVVLNTCGPQPGFEKIKPEFTRKQFVGIGRFTDKKAPYYTILAFKEVVSHYPDAKLVLAGDGVLLNTCKNLVNHLGLEENVRFLGVITSEEFQDILKESLAFVQHSITADNGDMEGTPLAVLEASAAGLPVISTLHAGIPDVIMHKETGLLCEEHDVEAMAEHMMSLLKHDSLAKSLGSSGKNYILKNYSLERHITKLDETLMLAVKNYNAST